MLIEHSGYRKNHGLFCFKIPVDENKTDYEIHFNNGSVYRQNGPFENVTHDWNCDGDVYTQFGAYFDCNGRGEFFTPVDLVTFVVEHEAQVPGIQDPFQHPSLDNQIKQAEEKKIQTDHISPSQEPER